MKIKCKHKHSWGKTINIPHDGEVEVGKAGVTEVSEAAAITLITKSTDWEEIPGQKKVVEIAAKNKKAVKSAKLKAVVEEEEEIEEELTEDDDGQAADADDAGEQTTIEASEFDKMDLENLVNIAETSEIPGWEKFRNNEKALRTYLKNRLNS